MSLCPAPRPKSPHPTRWDVLCSLASLVALGACGGGSGSSEAATPAGSPVASPAPAGSPAAAPTPAAAPAPAAWGTEKSQARVFISGHSLTDNPLGDHLVAIGNSLGGSNAAKYNEQIELGSPIRYRTEAQAGFAGYSRGKNRSGSGMNVINELRNPATLGGDRYDTLVIAENHNLLEMLQWEHTVRHLRHFHERLLAGNAQGRTYFYETWKDIYNKGAPGAWIAHERAASGAWQCIATRVNHALAAEGRNDRITPLPVGAALADLVERATQGNVAGITGANATETVNRLFSDDVHLTTTGMYYAALVTYAAVYQRSPVGASVPSGVSSTAADSLQAQAWSYVSNFYANYQPPSLDSCRAQVAQTFCATYWNYRGQGGNTGSCTSFFSATNANNPLYFDAAANAGYWYPAPP
jgi:hypothetical protein